MALSVTVRFETHNPRPLAGMLPCEDRTFLPTDTPKRTSSGGCPIAQADSSMALHWELKRDVKKRVCPELGCRASQADGAAHRSLASKRGAGSV